MIRRLRPLVVLLTLAVALPAAARNFDKQAQQARSEGLLALTVFVDADWGRREDGAARTLTRAHQAFATQGYQLVNVAPHVENGDLEGFFVSYRLQPAPAAAGGAQR